MQSFLLDMLQCPDCQDDLEWDIHSRTGDRIREGVATCDACQATYPIRDDIGVLLPSDVPRDDLWARSDTHLSQMFGQFPERYDQLMNGDIDALNPADIFLRARVLEEQRQFEASRAHVEVAMRGVYTENYRRCSNRQIEFVVEKVKKSTSPIVDIACGRGYLLEQLLKATDVPVIATDFSPVVLRRNRWWFEQAGLYDRLSLLVCDARRMPFKDAVIATMTTNVGLANVDKPTDLSTEIRRVVSGSLYAISVFYAEDDVANVAQLEAFGMRTYSVERTAVDALDNEGWRVTFQNACQASIEPTPISALFEITMDGMPVAPTNVTFGVLVGQKNDSD